MIAATGWTWEYIDDAMTIPRYQALCRHWCKYPPIHVTAALFVGIKSTKVDHAEPVDMSFLDLPKYE